MRTSLKTVKAPTLCEHHICKPEQGRKVFLLGSIQPAAQCTLCNHLMTVPHSLIAVYKQTADNRRLTTEG
jgi:hypothetical protein